jgi:biopolymer transport protein ExbB/TolQ
MSRFWEIFSGLSLASFIIALAGLLSGLLAKVFFDRKWRQIFAEMQKIQHRADALLTEAKASETRVGEAQAMRSELDKDFQYLDELGAQLSQQHNHALMEEYRRRARETERKFENLGATIDLEGPKAAELKREMHDVVRQYDNLIRSSWILRVAAALASIIRGDPLWRSWARR